MSTFVTWTAGRDARRRPPATRRAMIAVVAAVLAALGLLAAPSTATAEESELETVKTAWYFDSTAGTDATRTVGGIEVPDQEPPPENPTVPPDTLPVGMQNAEHQYRSAIKFALPDLPADVQITSFTISLHENSSSGTVTGLEACAFTQDFSEGRNQDMNDLPEFSCVFSTDGQPPEEEDPESDQAGVWTFDMPDTAESWLTDDPAEGGIENHGVVIQYVPPPNLDVGEPDPTQSNGRIFFDGEESENPPRATIVYTESSGEETTANVDLEETSGPAGGDQSTTAGDSGGGAPAGADGSGGGGGGQGVGFASSPQFESQPGQSQEAPAVEQEPAPEVAEQPEVAQDTQDTAAGQQPEPVAVVTPWYVWALLPIGLAGLYVLSRSLTAEPQIAVEREGVMTRLIESRRAAAETAGAGEPLAQV